MLDAEVRERFKEFQEKTGKYDDLDIDNVRFEKIYLNNDSYFEINPKKSEIDTELFTKNIDISFVPLPNIDAKTGILNPDETRKINDVKKGYTYFREGDVIFTKVTPSMENGNFAIAKNLINGIGFGSSEYYVFRCKKVHHKLLWFLFRADFFRNRAKRTMRGSGGLKRVPLEFFTTEYIPIPKDLDQTYTSLKIQEAIVEFLESSFEKNKRIKENIDKRYDLFRRLDKALIPSTFIKDYVKVAFGRYAKENNIDFSITDVDFEIKRIHSDNKDELICKKRMGFTPKTSINDNINWFRVEDLNATNGLFVDNPNTVKKTTMKKVIAKNGKKSSKNISIQKGDILVSFLATPGIVKIYNSDEVVYCNQAIDILTVTNDVDNRYIAYNCMLEYPKYGKLQTMGFNLNDEDKKKINIYIPKALDNYTSLEIQKIIADFMEFTKNRIQKKFDRMDECYDALKRLHKAYLARTFTLIDWEAR